MPLVAGQWTGCTPDNVAGQFPNAIIDLDDGDTIAQGTARVFTADGSPGATCDFKLPREFTEHQLQGVELYWMPSGQATMLNTNQIKAAYPDFQFPESINLKFVLDGNELSVSWQTGPENSGQVIFQRSPTGADSSLEAKDMTWAQFKDFALKQAPQAFVYRGQPEPYRLRTAFHRTYRKDLIRYVMEDIPTAHRLLSARTSHFFDASNPQQMGAFWNLLQHHGYPTPLLDWTYSPFVAAFFAFRRRKASDSKSNKVRIFAFDRDGWSKQFPQLDTVNFASLHFSLFEAISLENARAIPQQAISTLTNVDDIETLISKIEKTSGKTFLQAIDLPAENRPEIMVELSLMGITAGSLFPGLDGACEELMGRFFHHQLPPLKAD